MKKCVAIIPVRRFDALIKNKNILSFRNGSLLSEKIDILASLNLFTRVLVVTEDSELKKIAVNSGAQILDRPMELSMKDSSFNNFVEWTVDQIDEDHIMWAPVTAPLIKRTTFSKAFQIYFDMPNHFDSLITVRKLKRFLLDSNGPLNFRHHDSERNFSELPTLYEYVNAINIAPRLSMKKWRYNWGQIPYQLELDQIEGKEICDIVDYNLVSIIEQYWNN